MTEEELQFKYEDAAKRAAHFSALASDLITHELANYYQREAAKYAVLLKLKHKAHHHYGKTGHHCKYRVKLG